MSAVHHPGNVKVLELHSCGFAAPVSSYPQSPNSTPTPGSPGLSAVTGVGSLTTGQPTVTAAHGHNYGKVGHLKQVCKFSQSAGADKRPGGKRTKNTAQDSARGIEPSAVLNEIKAIIADKPLTIDVVLGGHLFPIKLDMGAAVPLMLEATYQDLFPDVILQMSSAALTSYSGEPSQ